MEKPTESFRIEVALAKLKGNKDVCAWLIHNTTDEDRTKYGNIYSLFVNRDQFGKVILSDEEIVNIYFNDVLNWCNILQKYNDIPYSEVSITCGETKLVVVIDKVNRCTYPPELNVVASYMLLNLIHIEIPRFGLLSSIIYSIKQHTKRICNEKLIEIEKLIVNNHNLTLSNPYKPSAQELRYKVMLVKDMAIQALNGVYIRTKDEEDAVDLPTTYKVNNPDKLTLHNKQKSSRVLSVADYVVIYRNI